MTFNVASGQGSLFLLISFLGVWHCGLLSLGTAIHVQQDIRWYLCGAFAGLGYIQGSLALLSTNLVTLLPFWIPFQFPLSSLGMAIAASFYLGSRGLLFPNRPTDGKDALHFLPAVIQLCVQIPVFVAGPLRPSLIERYTSIGLADSFIPGAEVPRIISLLYFALTVRLVWTYSQNAETSPGARPHLAYAVVATQGVLCLLLPIFSSDSYAWLRPVGIGTVTTLLVVWITTALVSLRRRHPQRTPPLSVDASGDRLPSTSATAATPNVSEERVSIAPAELEGASSAQKNASTTEEENIPSDSGDTNGSQESSKYETSPLTSERKERYCRRIVDYMETEEPYLDADLSLDRMAQQVDLHPRYVSQVVNETLEQSFTQWVNAHRVEAAKEFLRDASLQHLTVVAVAHRAGFNSKSAFYAAFKDRTGTTPATFRENNEDLSVEQAR